MVGRHPCRCANMPPTIGRHPGGPEASDEVRVVQEDPFRKALTMRLVRGMLLRMAISLLVIVMVWLFVLLELRSSWS